MLLVSHKAPSGSVIASVDRSRRRSGELVPGSSLGSPKSLTAQGSHIDVLIGDGDSVDRPQTAATAG